MSIAKCYEHFKIRVDLIYARVSATLREIRRGVGVLGVLQRCVDIDVDVEVPSVLLVIWFCGSLGLTTVPIMRLRSKKKAWSEPAVHGRPY